MSNDSQIRQHISDLVAEEHELRDRLGQGEVDADEERQRLSSVEVELDQCWDLLRQRQARRDAGADADEAQARAPETVENYRQ
ncbi:MAG TPA: DUF2630 family protein [Nocardioidaceae bacterium]|nr:DUF2630 family protein [Nocardioidaceae bacterium]